MNKRILFIYLFFVFCLLIACKQEDGVMPKQTMALMEIPKGFPEVNFPEGNEFSIARWELGKQLFYDPILSLDSSVSCASCHRSDLAFSDEVAVSPGVAGRLGTRNAPSLANVAYHPYFTREGGVPTLEMQVLVPIQEHDEFDFNMVLLVERLNQNTSYIEMAKKAYDRLPDPFVITRALACFERSLLSGYSPYDQYLNYDQTNALNELELIGMNLFFSEKTNCSKCHDGFNFTNYAFENNGLYEVYEDAGRFRLTGKEEDKALFKIPSLRNIEMTAPYMHDGSLKNLEEVIEHYQTGGKNHPHKSPLLQALDLTEMEKTALIQFLKSLTDKNFINNPRFTK